MSQISQVQIIAAVEEALELTSGTIKENTVAEEVENWDSLGQLSVLVALDKLYDGKIASMTEMAEADSIPKILEILKQHNLYQ